MSDVRVRFAPSPTGPLHIGGLRTALYNYLWAKKNNGVFILRIEDTDQKRYVEGAEEYIREALNWAGLIPDEGPSSGGDFGPYRQSERKEYYQKYIELLIGSGKAYYAFDTVEELETMKEQKSAEGIHSPKYDWSVREEMKNSLTMSPDELSEALNSGTTYVIRLKVMPNEKISFADIVRGDVSFNSSELDDKVLLNSDGLPTYHFANVVDDYSMKISHVIRGEEWLSSTAHHVLLYRALGWEEVMPLFAHLPLILKPQGKGKLSKRDGAKFGIPVFPLLWKSNEEDDYQGFKEAGFNEKAMINFLAFLGWNPGTDEEIFSLDQLSEAFSLDSIVKAGAKFDFEKALWYNQQYIITEGPEGLAPYINKELNDRIIEASYADVMAVATLYYERISTYNELWSACSYCFSDVSDYDRKNIKKKWKGEAPKVLESFVEVLEALKEFTEENVENTVKSFLEQNDWGFGMLLPQLRLALTGTMKGPSIFGIATVLGKEETLRRLKNAPSVFEKTLSISY